MNPLIAGAIAGAAGEIALNLASYADMIVRSRPAGEMPGKVAERLATGVGLDLAQPGERPEKAEVRREAGGAILGYGMAIGTAVAYAMLRRAGLRVPVAIGGLLMGGAAMAVSDSTAIVMRVTDPGSWGLGGWLSDIVPHAAYGLAAAAALELIDP